MRTLLLLLCSNIFMTFAWYGHLKFGHDWPLWRAILISWMIALIEYCFAVPANRIGFGQYTGFQLKVLQEAVTLVIFLIFAVTFLKERIAWNYIVSFCLLILAVVFAFAFKPAGELAQETKPQPTLSAAAEKNGV
ncbi:MAG: DMT family protein [Verrucomicrobiota bacterium]